MLPNLNVAVTEAAIKQDHGVIFQKLEKTGYIYGVIWCDGTQFYIRRLEGFTRYFNSGEDVGISPSL